LAFTIMSELLSGARPLRGRSRLDLVVPPFDYRTAGKFWGIADHEVALRLHAVLGGTPVTAISSTASRSRWWSWTAGWSGTS
jgi:hypothetical protein